MHLQTDPPSCVDLTLKKIVKKKKISDRWFFPDLLLLRPREELTESRWQVHLIPNMCLMNCCTSMTSRAFITHLLILCMSAFLRHAFSASLYDVCSSPSNRLEQEMYPQVWWCMNFSSWHHGTCIIVCSNPRNSFKLKRCTQVKLSTCVCNRYVFFFTCWHRGLIDTGIPQYWYNLWWMSQLSDLSKLTSRDNKFFPRHSTNHPSFSLYMPLCIHYRTLIFINKSSLFH